MIDYISYFQDLFADFSITWAVETTLGANQWQSSSSRLPWMTAKRDQTELFQSKSIETDANGKTTVQLVPMDIRTFIIRVSAK